MLEKLPPFKSLQEHFPATDAPSVKRLIGGKVNAPWITNACAIRLSRALNYAGQQHRIPKPNNPFGLNVISGSDRLWYAFRYLELVRYTQVFYGKPSTVLTGKDAANPAKLTGLTGIIAFDVGGWGDATGHIDLWNGGTCSKECYFLPGPGAKTHKLALWTC
jgi:hypothetical protein